MRLVFIAFFVLYGGQALAAACDSGNSELLSLRSWSAGKSDLGTKVTFEVESTATKPIKMVNASLWFEDALGGKVGDMGLYLQRDLKIAPGESQTLELDSTPWRRLLNVDKADVTGAVCTYQVLYADGSKEEF